MEILKLVIAFAFPVFILIIALCYIMLKPKKDSKFLGYRSQLSVQNPAIWNTAQKLFGQRLLIGSVIALILGSGYLSVNHTFLKAIFIILEFVVISLFGMSTEFTLYREFKE